MSFFSVAVCTKYCFPLLTTERANLRWILQLFLSALFIEHTTEPKVGKNWICNLVSSSRQPLTLQLQAVNRYLFKTSGHRFSWCTMNEKYCKEKKDHIRYIQQHWQRNTIFIYIYLMALILSILCIMFLRSIIVVKLSIWNHLYCAEAERLDTYIRYIV